MFKKSEILHDMHTHCYWDGVVLAWAPITAHAHWELPVYNCKIQHHRFIQDFPFTHFTFWLQQGETWLQLSLNCLFGSVPAVYSESPIVTTSFFPCSLCWLWAAATFLYCYENALLVQFRLQSFASFSSTSTLQGSPSHCSTSPQCHENIFIQKSKCQVIPSHCVTPRPSKKQVWRVHSLCKTFI